MGRVWEWNSNWEATHFWENVFLNSWASKFLEMHAHPMVHPSVMLSHVFWSFCVFSFTSWQFPPFLHSWKFVLVLLSECVARIHDLGVYRSVFVFPHSWSLLCIYLHIFLSFPHFPIPRILFLVLCSEWEKETHDLGVYGDCFSPTMPWHILWKCISLTGCFSPFY